MHKFVTCLRQANEKWTRNSVHTFLKVSEHKPAVLIIIDEWHFLRIHSGHWGYFGVPITKEDTKLPRNLLRKRLDKFLQKYTLITSDIEIDEYLPICIDLMKYLWKKFNLKEEKKIRKIQICDFNYRIIKEIFDKKYLDRINK